ncbi:alpha/beta fold hydrolase [Kitasatospora sp. NPDC056327]|uniref:alpha/beta fold hydrolase n=1 Tax=Kitasatospora sp. NPDC056327 TaxID=3345785 RepID=UPI0035D9D319
MRSATPVRPTVVLVHGAFADASCWAGVAERLHAAGAAVRAPANPLRGLEEDAAHLRNVLRDVDGPVVLVGHGYGGAVITHAATDAENVVALCYAAAFGLDTGECVRDISNRFARSPVSDATVTAALPGEPPGGPGSGLRISDEHFPQLYAGDLPPATARALSAAQRPVAPGALTSGSGPPAWASRPCWYAIATADRLLDPAAQRFMAQRMAATEHPVDASHAVVRSRPDAVAAMILEAVGRTCDDGAREGFRTPRTEGNPRGV